MPGTQRLLVTVLTFPNVFINFCLQFLTLLTFLVGGLKYMTAEEKIKYLSDKIKELDRITTEIETVFPEKSFLRWMAFW